MFASVNSFEQMHMLNCLQFTSSISYNSYRKIQQDATMYQKYFTKY